MIGRRFNTSSILNTLTVDQLLYTEYSELMEITGLTRGTISGYITRKGLVRPTRVERVLGEYSKDELLNIKRKQLSLETGISEQAIYQHLKKLGLSHRQNRERLCISEEDYKRYSIQQLAIQHNCSPTKISTYLKETYARKRKRNFDYSMITEELMLSDYGYKIAKKYGMSSSNLSMYCKRKGLPFRKVNEYGGRHNTKNTNGVGDKCTHDLNIYEFCIKYDTGDLKLVRENIIKDYGLSFEEYKDIMINGTYDKFKKFGFDDSVIIESTVAKIYN